MVKAVLKYSLLAFLGSFMLPVWSNSLTTITYHDVVADPGEDAYAVSRSEFVAQMDYLKNNKYKVISLNFLNAVQLGKEKLPQKAVLLTFDDGLSSYYDFVAPILKIYKFPSVAALVTGWLDGSAVPKEYQNKLLTWDQIKELSQSPLVEFISHTNSLHRGLATNAQGNERPAAITRQFFPFNQTYETAQEYRQRIKYDLGVSVTRLIKQLGKQPIGIAWPYGKYNRIAIEEATALGMKFQLTLDEGPTNIEQFPEINRLMLVNNPSIGDFANELAYGYQYDDPMSFVDIELDLFVGQPVWKQEEILGRMLDDLQRRKINMVILSPFTKNDKKAFYHTEQMPVASDILNRVIHQLRERVPIHRVFINIPGNIVVKDIDRLYEDLASFTWMDGVVFTKDIDAKSVAKIKRVIHQYLPRIKTGILGSKQVDFDYDFIIYPIHVANAPDRIQSVGPKINRVTKPVYVYLKSESDSNNAQLKAAIQSLQLAGIKHYGYRLNPKVFINDNAMVSN